MKNFIVKKVLQSRNYLRYLLTNPFIEIPSITLNRFFKDNNFRIQNKIENLEQCVKNYQYTVIKNLKVSYITLDISEDHLINAEILNGSTNAKIKTRDLEKILLFLKENLEQG